ncbi:MAG TPA: glutamate-cysteine ligase family protein [Acidimicrobiales bacterium]|nr:glutamate-cysteine ligase family protein [Acidimicrobiales bacterium]
MGVELEMLAMGPDGRRAPHDLVATVVASLAPLRSGTSITFEPGGQVELSTPPAADVEAACDGLENDLGLVAKPLAELGIALVGIGIDPSPNVDRVIRSPRYDAMEAWYEGQDQGLGRAGRTMMRATAGLQVNLDFDARSTSPDTRWGTAHVLGPILAASFANSPLVRGVPSGWKSYRLANWWRLDPTRTKSPAGAGPGPEAWTAYVMGAQVMLIRTDDGGCVAVNFPLTFRQWATDGHPLGFPTLDDLDYHVTTLFPPVRPRGWLELRMVDSLPDPWWRVPVAVATALVYDGEAGEAAAQAAWDTADLWVEASRSGLAHRGLADAAGACFRIALDALRAMGAGRATMDAVAGYLDRYVDRGRCPADDVLDHWRRTGALFLPGDVSWAARPQAAVRP